MRICMFPKERNARAGGAYYCGLDRVFSLLELSCLELEHASHSGEVGICAGFWYDVDSYVGLKIWRGYYLTKVTIVGYGTMKKEKRQREMYSRAQALRFRASGVGSSC